MSLSKHQSQIYDNFEFNGYEFEKFKKILPYLKKVKNPKIVDLAGGEGQFYDLLSKYKSDMDYTIVELSQKQRNIAKKKGIKTLSMDLAKKFKFKDNSFDIIIASEIIEHIFDTKYFLSECNRILRKGGILVITTPNIATIGNRLGLLIGNRPSCIDARVEGSPGHIRAFVKEDLVKLHKDAKLKIIKLVGIRLKLPIINYKKKMYKLNYTLANWFPTLSNGFIIISKKL